MLKKLFSNKWFQLGYIIALTFSALGATSGRFFAMAACILFMGYVIWFVMVKTDD